MQLETGFIQCDHWTERSIWEADALLFVSGEAPVKMCSRQQDKWSRQWVCVGTAEAGDAPTDLIPAE